MSDITQLCRSFQTAPAVTSGENSAKYLDSIGKRDGLEIPDWFAPDLEDATPPGMEPEGQENVIEFTNKFCDFKGKILPRVNWAYYDVDEGTDVKNIREQGKDDIRTLIQGAGEQLDGFVIPKVGRVDNVKEAADIISTAEHEYGYEFKTFGMYILIESCRSVSDLRKIALLASSRDRCKALIFGPGDYSFDVGGRISGSRFPSWDTVKELLSNEASANNLLSIGGPFGTIYKEKGGKQYYNGDEYAEYVKNEGKIGFDGSWSLHPNQTVQANYLHSPSKEELREVIERKETFNDQNESGAMLMDGELLDVGMEKYWNRTMLEAITVYEHDEKQAVEIYDGIGIIERANDIMEEMNA